MRRLLIPFLAAMIACSGCVRRKTIWVYTSAPREAIEEMVEPVAAGVPSADVKWFQGSSEAVHARLAAEWDAGKPKADLVLTSDPFAYVELRDSGRLLPYASPAAAAVPGKFRDPSSAFSSVRINVVVLGYNPRLVKAADVPERWSDLTQPRYKDKVSMGSPFDSVAHFAAVAMLAETYGWEYFSKLRANGIVAENGGTAVLSRIESGERPIGILTLDNLLKAQARGTSAQPVYPLDGAITVPGPIAILKDSANPEVARKVYDWFFSAMAQNAFVRAGMYSPLPDIVSPDRARKWNDLSLRLMKWEPAVRDRIHRERDRIRAKFSEVVLH